MSYSVIVERNKYNPEKDSPFKVSRSAIELFVKCPRCYYMNARLGFREFPSPGWSINIAVDDLVKKEMDFCRKKDCPHPLFKENNLNIKPFNHEDLSKWQHTFTGIQFYDKNLNFLVYGGVDDIMVNEKDELVVIDFKATAKKPEILTPGDVYDNGAPYKRQLEIYSWLLSNNGFKVSSIGYLMYYNGDKSQPHLGKTMHFRRTLVPFDLDTSWIGPTLNSMHECLQKESIPELNTEKCDKCLYRETYLDLKKLYDK